MMDPKRLLTAGSPTARSLLRAAERDAPPASLVPALMVSLGAVTAGPAVGAKLGMAIRHAAFSKISIAIVAVAAASGGGYVVSRMHERAPRADLGQRPNTTVGSADAAPMLAAQQPRTNARAVEIVPPAPSSATAARSTPRVEQHERRHDVAAPHPTVALSAAPSIVGELNEIRHVGSLVVAGDGKGALDALDIYVASHPGGTFEEEALALRVRALRLTGDRIGAERSLHTFETRFPNSVYLVSLEPEGARALGTASR
jgi:hypothetical protein